MLRDLRAIAPDRTSRLVVAYVLTAVVGLLQGGVLALTIVALDMLFDTEGAPWLLLAGIVVSIAASIVVERRADLIRAAESRRAAHSVVKQTVRHAARLPLGWFFPANHARLSRVSDGIHVVELSLNFMYGAMVSAYTRTAVVVLFLAVFVNPFASLLVVLTSAATITMAAIAAGPLSRSDAARRAADAAASAQIVEYAQAHSVLRAFAGASQAASSVLDAYTRADREAWRGTLIRIGATLALPEMFGALALIGTVFVGVAVEAPTYAVVIGLVAIVWQTTWLAVIGRVWNNIGDARTIVVEARAILDTAPLSEPDQPRALPRSGAVANGTGGLPVEFRDVSFAYREGKPVVRSVSFVAPAASTLALVGPSGAGKSTVLRLVARFWDVTSGAVLVGGVNVREVASKDLMDAFAVVFQDVYMFEGSIRENLLCARPDATDAELADAAARANLTEVLDDLPEGWETRVGDRGITLSGGQRQRVSIARALLKDAPVVLLDEPTAALDAHNQRLFSAAVRELARKRTVIMITHQLASAAHADQIVFLAGGRVAEAGTHAQLLEADGAYAAYWNRQHAQI